ncbi:MAG: hypothetical protein MUF54_24710 [Polyangiaceae bacterium]|nr:hypothetical protein [Polyangiaceae bacterium]
MSVAIGITGLLAAAPAQAQIKQPGRHIKYDVELEPHFVYQWSDGSVDDDGVGVGLRVSIPIVDNGPIKKINNSMAISFGVDWAHFEGYCGWWWRDRRYDPRDGRYYWWNEDCESDQFWFPVVLQWNFWLTDVISVFGEPGLALQHERWDYYQPCAAGWCDDTESDTDLEFVFWGGARFLLSDSVAITLRLGRPSFNAGLSFFL